MSPKVSARVLATQPDARLQQLVARGYERAFEAIVHRYRRPLLAYCRRLGLAEGRAEDVVQQSLLKAWLALRAGSDVRELRPWLYRIVHNTALNAIRGARDQSVDVAALSAELYATHSEVDQHLAARQTLADVAALPQMQRDVLLMSAVDGRSHEEVAGELGISSGAVRGLLYRARSTLRGAAAAITPAPLLRWASDQPGGPPTASAVAQQLAAAGSGDAGGALLKGAALAVSAALAAGAVLVPSHHHDRAAASGGSTAGGRPAPTADGAGAPAVSTGYRAASQPTSGAPRSGEPSARLLTRTSAPRSGSGPSAWTETTSRGGTTTTTRGAGSPAGGSPSVSVSAASAGTTHVSESPAAPGHGETPSGGETGKGGSEPPKTEPPKTEPPKNEPPPTEKGDDPPGDGGETTTTGGASEREAEEKRELAEREAEEAREHREEEATRERERKDD